MTQEELDRMCEEVREVAEMQRQLDQQAESLEKGDIEYLLDVFENKCRSTHEDKCWEKIKRYARKGFYSS